MKRILLIAATVASMAGMASASTITITEVVGTWGNAQGTTVSGEGTNQISWGTPATNAGSSSYVFNARTTDFEPVNNPFLLGEFVHNNFPVFPPSITGADLSVSVTGNVGGEVFNLGGVYRFSHFETPNGESPCAAGGSNPCPDLVTYEGAVSFTGDTITVDGIEYVLGITGFADSLTFLTEENASNSAGLFAEFTSNPVTVDAVPLPAPLLLFGTGLAAFGVARRAANRKKA